MNTTVMNSRFLDFELLLNAIGGMVNEYFNEDFLMIPLAENGEGKSRQVEHIGFIRSSIPLHLSGSTVTRVTHKSLPLYLSPSIFTLHPRNDLKLGGN